MAGAPKSMLGGMKSPETLLGAVVIAAGVIFVPFVAPANEVGRYEIVFRDGGDGFGSGLYLLDTETGETFRRTSSEWRLFVEPIQ